jgi:hypothetical protein
MVTLLEQVLAMERAVWEALVAGDAVADGALLAPGFLGVYPTGFAGRSDHVAQLAAGPTVRDYRLSAARVLPLGPDHALLAYRADYRRAGADRTETMFVASVWERTLQGWVNLFSQDTPLSDRDPP